MRILVHDFAGHAFPVQLSRELARRGNEVLHLHFGTAQTPKGGIQRRPGDPISLVIDSIDISSPLQKYSFFTRRYQELEYGRRLANRAAFFKPDVIISAQTPLEAQAILFRRFRGTATRIVFWTQDLYGEAVYRLLKRRWFGLGRLIGLYYKRLERRLFSQSDAVVFITSDFAKFTEGWYTDPLRTHIIENWAPLDEMVPLGRKNTWSRHHNLDDKTVFMYSGTMGLKHNPSLLLDLAEHYKDRDDIAVVVISQGIGADWLKEETKQRGLTKLKLLPYQPYEDLGSVLSSADVLIATIEPDASIFSVPSKVLSYLNIGRPILLAVPSNNLAARKVLEAEAGVVVDPSDSEGFVAAADRLVNEQVLARSMARNARAYALDNFDIARIADRFETILRPWKVAELEQQDQTPEAGQLTG